MNVGQTLQYLGESVSREKRPFDYTGTLDANTQAQFNALIWNDSRPKPSWQQLQQAEAHSNLWHAQRAWMQNI